MPGKSEFKLGFWVGLGLFLAFAVLSFFQLALMRAWHLKDRNG